MRLARKLTLAGVLLAGFAMLSTSTAYADPGAGAAAVTGQGTINPGLTAELVAQTVAFNGTAVGAFANTSPAADVGTASCSFSGSSSSLGDNYVVGTGTVGGGCNGSGIVTGTGIDVDCGAMAYVRVGTIVLVVDVNCTVVVNDASSHGPVVGAFNFIPTGDPQRVQSYLLTGVAGFAGT